MIDAQGINRTAYHGARFPSASNHCHQDGELLFAHRGRPTGSAKDSDSMIATGTEAIVAVRVLRWMLRILLPLTALSATACGPDSVPLQWDGVVETVQSSQTDKQVRTSGHARDPDTRPELIYLEPRTYNEGWIRFRNPVLDGQSGLGADGSTEFPFRFAVHAHPFGFAEMDTHELPLAQLRTASFNDMVGYCDVTALADMSTDLVCVPGKAAMPKGFVYLVLYHPDTLQVAAVTATIYNLGDPALDASPHEDGPGAAFPDEQPLGKDIPAGCGPFHPGQWVSLPQYDRAQQEGISLRTAAPDGKGPVSAYRCQGAAAGGFVLQAYAGTPTLERPGSEAAEQDGIPSWLGRFLASGGRVCTDQQGNPCRSFTDRSGTFWCFDDQGVFCGTDSLVLCPPVGAGDGNTPSHSTRESIPSGQDQGPTPTGSDNDDDDDDDLIN